MHISIESLVFSHDFNRKTEAVGIDFGTTYCVVAFCEHGLDTQILHAQKRSLIPSEILADGHTISSIKRKLAKVSVQDISESVYLYYATRLFKEIASHIEQSLNRAILSAVITVPAYFDNVQRSYIQKAATSAGFNVLRLLSEPTAAALTYGITHSAEGRYAVYDWGGGTFDFSVLEMKQGIFKVLATGGEAFLGGDDFDRCIAEHISPTSLSDLPEQQQMHWILEAKKIKEMLSYQDKNDQYNITKKDIECWCLPLFNRTVEICEETLRRIKLDKSDIKKIILVGGTTRVPFVFEHLNCVWNKNVDRTLHPEYAVASGAAQQAYQLTHGHAFLLLDVSPLTLGVEVLGGIVESLIPRNTPLPSFYTYHFTTSLDGQTVVRLHIVQGEKEFAKDCRSLGVFELSGITPLPKGMARIELKCSLTVDGLLELEASECTTGETQAKASLHINTTKNITDTAVRDEVQALGMDDGSDVLRRIYVQKKYQAFDALHQMKKILQSAYELFTEEEYTHIKNQCESFGQFLEEDIPTLDISAIEKMSEHCENFSIYILPFIERHLTWILKNAFEKNAL